jgi:L-alanine-DL-glutamate epimerase-like enolase superfamily enzyme
MKLQEVKLRTIRLLLIRPYVLSCRTFTEFEPIIVEVRDGDGRVGWGEGHISPGSSRETREGGWAFCSTAVVGPVHCRRTDSLNRKPGCSPSRCGSPQASWCSSQDTRQRSMPTC